MLLFGDSRDLPYFNFIRVFWKPSFSACLKFDLLMASKMRFFEWRQMPSGLRTKRPFLLLFSHIPTFQFEGIKSSWRQLMSSLEMPLTGKMYLVTNSDKSLSE